MVVPFATRIGSGSEATVYLITRDTIVLTATEWEAGYFPARSPTIAPKPVLYLWGNVPRYWVQAKPKRLRALCTPTQPAYRLGRRHTPKRPLFWFTGEVQQIDHKTIVLVRGEMEDVPIKREIKSSFNRSSRDRI